MHARTLRNPKQIENSIAFALAFFVSIIVGCANHSPASGVVDKQFQKSYERSVDVSSAIPSAEAIRFLKNLERTKTIEITKEERLRWCFLDTSSKPFRLETVEQEILLLSSTKIAFISQDSINKLSKHPVTGERFRAFTLMMSSKNAARRYSSLTLSERNKTMQALYSLGVQP